LADNYGNPMRTFEGADKNDFKIEIIGDIFTE
jgi:hypothetical protein